MSRPTEPERDNAGEYSLQDWLESARTQPALPDDLPDWVRRLAEVTAPGADPDAGESGIGAIFNEPARTVPELGPDGTPPRYSAVLVLLGDGDGGEHSGETTVLLTHRNPRMRTHSGQIAFPGGRREAQDADPVATAVREAVEETALDPTSVVPVSVMAPLYIDRTNHAVIPVVAWWRTPGPVHPATQESDWVRAFPVARLADPANRRRIGFLSWHGPAFDVDGYLLWGFTGGVVDALLTIAGWERPWEEPWADGEPAAVADLFAALEASRNGENLAAEALGDRLDGELENDRTHDSTHDRKESR
ncbi:MULTISPECIES: NUDIX hydrolase [unclassified Corynebacterium]|uniref:NUDIX hydrolase n=1 Tax=unclassified Corynebacterium TaxID=2624378 RepID=UPI00264BDB99|nr:CoA pyrophosphatase [Corynebacterium sp.]